MEIKQTIKDFKFFLSELEKLSKPLSKEQKDSLNTILKSQLTLLVMLKKASNLGAIQIDWRNLN